MERNKSYNILDIAKRYFSVSNEKDSEEVIYKYINQGISFKGSNLWILIFAIFTASLGLNVNSTAVIIGAMLISPLMAPIIGMGLAVGTNDFDLLKRSLKNYGISTLISITTASIYFLLTPFDDAQSELLARTSPTLYDVMIAFFGGAAGIVAISTIGGKTGNVIPGVAIATALMPPLCTAGFGIGTGNLRYFIGAAYLYFINSVFIALATYLGSRMMKFKHKIFIDQKRYKRVRQYILALVIVTMVPAFFMTIRIVKDSIFERSLKSFISSNFTQEGTQIISHEVNKADKTITLVSIGKQIPNYRISDAIDNLDRYNLKNYTLNLIQGSQSDSVIFSNTNISDFALTTERYNRKLNEQESKISSLQKELDSYKRYTDLSKSIYLEAKTIYPQIVSLGLSKVIQLSDNENIKVKNKSTDKSSLVSIEKIIVIIHIDEKLYFTQEDKDKFINWVSTRLESSNVELIIR